MRILLVGGADRLPSEPIADALTELGTSGIQIDLVAWSPPRSALRAHLTGWVVLGPLKEAVEAPPVVAAGTAGDTDAMVGPEHSAEADEQLAPEAVTGIHHTEADTTPQAACGAPASVIRPRPTGLSKARIEAAVRWRRRRLRAWVRRMRHRMRWVRRLRNRSGFDVMIRQRLVWRRFRRAPMAVPLADRADVIVSLDGPATLTVWKLAQRNRQAIVVVGIVAAATQLRHSELLTARSAIGTELSNQCSERATKEATAAAN
jgi:hypothetical protein